MPLLFLLRKKCFVSTLTIWHSFIVLTQIASKDPPKPVDIDNIAFGMLKVLMTSVDFPYVAGEQCICDQTDTY